MTARFAAAGQPLAKRCFDERAQQAFATLSGDWNPIHIDRVAARRTLAGTPVVHGIHLLAWSLDAACAAGAVTRPITALSAGFSHFVAVGQEVDLHTESSGDTLHLRIAAGDIAYAEIVVRFGTMSDVAAPILPASPVWAPGRTPHDLPNPVKGVVPSASPETDWALAFPAAAAHITAARLAALGTSTRLVGMVWPGLHSLYAGLHVTFDEDLDEATAIAFEAQAPRHGLTRILVGGGGLHGRLDALVRPAPARQPSAAALGGLLPPNVLRGHHALVVGGSRGLGEVAAKLIASAGGHVTLTYHQGAADAHAIAADIVAESGACDVLRLDVYRPIAEQLAALSDPPSHAWYFATGRIGQAGSRFFDQRRFDELFATHVKGFWDVAMALRTLNPATRLFYPSSIYVDDRPAGLAEYAMAKAAGEILCGEINATMPPLVAISRRLPPLATDQNATSTGIAGDDPVATILSLIATVHEL